MSAEADRDWPRLRELVFVAEDTDFSADASRTLAPRLLELALRHRDSNDPQDEPAVWSAIRCGAAMLRPDDAGLLLPLLGPCARIQTDLVAVKMLGRIFEAQPPTGIDQHQELAVSVREMANALLNPYVIAAAQSAAMAQLAVYALAAMGSSDTLEVASRVRAMGATWFTVQTRRDLRELQTHWRRRPDEVADGPRELLDRAIGELDR